MMRRRLLTIGKTGVYLHLATVLFAIYMVAMGAGTTMIIGTISILLHESAHAGVSSAFGCPPREVELTPLGALMRLEDENCLPVLKRLLMLLAGPAMSLLLCWLSIWLTRQGLLGRDEGKILFLCNMGIVMLNLLPALPLDGGRVLSLILSCCLRGETVGRIMRILGIVLGMACIAGNVAATLILGGWNFTLAAAGCFLMYAGAISTTSAALTELRMFMDRKIRLEKRGRLPCQWITVTDGLTIRQAIACLKPQQYTMYQLVESGTMRPMKQVSEDQLIAAYLSTPGESCAIFLNRESAPGEDRGKPPEGELNHQKGKKRPAGRQRGPAEAG